MNDHEFIAQLCVRIGMIMEDVCGEAVMARPEKEAELRAIVERLQEAGERISALVHAASMLTRNG